MRFVVLGTGRMGARRAALLAGHPGVEEVWLAGGDAERTRTVAEQCGARPVTVADALAAQPDGVVVASATDRHPEQLAACAALGVPVLCEKPIALSVEATSAAVSGLEAAGVRAQVGFQRRFDPGFRAARAAVADGALGTLYSLRLTARDADPPPEHYVASSGGIFRDMHVHDFDLARWITSQEVAGVFATGTIRAHEHLRAHGDADVTAAVLTMADGLPVLVDGSRHDPRGYDVRLEVLGSADAVVVGLSARTPLRSLDAPGGAPGGEPAWRSFAERFADAFAAETAAFVGLVRDGGESACPPGAALEALRIAEACERSRAQGRPVALAEIPA